MLVQRFYSYSLKFCCSLVTNRERERERRRRRTLYKLRDLREKERGRELSVHNFHIDKHFYITFGIQIWSGVHACVYTNPIFFFLKGTNDQCKPFLGLLEFLTIMRSFCRSPSTSANCMLNWV